MSDASTQPPPAGPSTLDADLRATAAACVDVVWAQDRERRITYISSGVAALTGYPPEQYLGRRLHELPWVQLMPGAIDQARAAFAAHRPYRDRRLTVTHRDGRQLVL